MKPILWKKNEKTTRSIGCLDSIFQIHLGCEQQGGEGWWWKLRGFRGQGFLKKKTLWRYKQIGGEGGGVFFF